MTPPNTPRPNIVLVVSRTKFEERGPRGGKMRPRKKSYPPRLIIHGVTAEAWAKRWGLEPFTHPCYACDRPCTTTLPFMQGTLVGLQAPVCECGHPAPPFVMMRNPKYGDLLSPGTTLAE